jgi:hypothetical protein
MPMCDCNVLAFAEGEIHTVAAFGFDHEAPTDPEATFTFALGRDGLSSLRDTATRTRLASESRRGSSRVCQLQGRPRRPRRCA